MSTPPTPPKRSSASSIHFLPQPATTAKPHLHRGGSSDAPLHTAPRRPSKHQHKHHAKLLLSSHSQPVKRVFVCLDRPAPLEQSLHLVACASVSCRPGAIVRLPLPPRPKPPTDPPAQPCPSIPLPSPRDHVRVPSAIDSSDAAFAVLASG